MGKAIPELSLGTPGVTRRFPVKPCHGIVSWGCWLCPSTLRVMSGSIGVMRKQKSSFSVNKRVGRREQERLQPYKEGSDWAERNSLRWLGPDSLKLGAKALFQKLRMGQGSGCWHQLDQDIAGCCLCNVKTLGFTWSEIFPWQQHSAGRPACTCSPLQCVLRCWSHAWSLWVTLLWHCSLWRAHGKLPVDFSSLLSFRMIQEKYFLSSALAETVACCLNLLMEFPNYVFQLKTIIILSVRCMIA